MSISQPALIIFDVNETHSDMSPLQQRFEEVGLDAREATTWFATLLRDGFDLTVTGANPSLASSTASAGSMCTVAWWTESMLWPSMADGS